jgi:hypothetical protein
MSSSKMRSFLIPLSTFEKANWIGPGPLAHLVEHFICNEEVASSSLARSTLKAFLAFKYLPGFLTRRAHR